MSSFNVLNVSGSVLSDRDIQNALDQGLLEIRSPYPLQFQPSSMDVHLSRNILSFTRRRVSGAVIDLKKPVDDYMEYEVMNPKKGTVLHPHEFILGVTTEWFHLSGKLLANVEGKSSLGRLGLVIHATAGFIDPGFKGHVTLEITNLTDLPMVIYPEMLIGQIRFSVLSSEAKHLYGEAILKNKYKNDYSNDAKPMASQYWKNFVK